jgi:hypothetical protein
METSGCAAIRQVRRAMQSDKAVHTTRQQEFVHWFANTQCIAVQDASQPQCLFPAGNRPMTFVKLKPLRSKQIWK